ncbi:XrtA/PEP-CTERM system-associated ATPase [Agaribacter flavus]|uniref:XrtA/PEP-CTERM system-associated ATPase n=1 Tax=Agaribacter flavus TaxID=1902781 RepID=A0ABV7FNZ2_9ALTE
MYESHYGLNSKPFQLTPDPEFFYASKLHKRAMSYLQYGLSQAEGFIVVTGDIGTGKTTIANSLLNEIENDIYAVQIVTPKLNPDELIKMVASKLMLPVEGRTKSELLEAIQAFLQTLASQGKRALLLVDEAQNLPLETIEELRMLSNFQQEGKPLLQSFLLGQAELQPILRAPNMEQFRQRIVASCHLAPLSREEMQKYVEYRLAHAGCENINLISNQAFDAIYTFTNGVPRKVNTLMDRVLLFGFLEELDGIDEDAANQVIDEVKAEMFVPENANTESFDKEVASVEKTKQRPTEFTPNGNKIEDAAYYKAMLGELVDALDDAIKHKIKLTQYIDKLLKQKYQAYVRLKTDKDV